MRRATALPIGIAAALLVVGAVAASADADETTRVSNAPSGAAGAGSSNGGSISADGSVIAFQSRATDLVPGDTNGYWDVFALDRASGVIERISVATGGTEGNGDSFGASLSADGRFVVFSSSASNLDTDPNRSVSDVFLRDRTLGTTTLVSRDLKGKGANGGSGEGGISADGQRIVFASDASNLVANDVRAGTDVFLYDVATSSITLLSTAADGTQANDVSFASRISPDGNVVAFSSYATNLPDPPLGYPYIAAYIRDLTTGAVERIDLDSSGAGADGFYHFVGSMSDDGSLVLFDVSEPLVPDDTNASTDVFLRDRPAGTTERVSLGTGARQADRGAWSGRLSGDGRFVAFSSEARNLVDDDDNDTSDVYLRDRLHDVTTRISIGTHDEQGAYSGLYGSSISADGKLVVFDSYSPDFVANDGNQDTDVFLRTRSRIVPTWTNYGTGFPGRDGTVPTMTLEDAPYRGAEIVIDVTCSSRLYAAAFLFVGLARDSLPTSLGGTLLVAPALLLPIPLSPFGGTLPAVVPTNWWANGLVVDLQTLELDPWAAKGVSFTDGLELVLGDG